MRRVSTPTRRWGCAIAASSGLLLWLAACSSSSHGTPAEAGTSTDSGTDDAAFDAGIESGRDSGSAPPAGSIVIVQLVGLNGTVGDITASFDAQYPSGLACVRTVSGPCTIDDCTAVDMQGATLQGQSAGTLTLVGGTPSTTAMLHAGAGDLYKQPLGGNPLFAAGDVFAASADGGTFPAFSGQSAPAPGAVAITSPTTIMGSDGPTYKFDPTAALAWTWTGGQAGTSVIFTTYTSSPDLAINCAFDSTAGAGTIPQDVLAKLPATPSLLQIVAATSTTLAVGSQGVLFELETGGAQSSLTPQ